VAPTFSTWDTRFGLTEQGKVEERLAEDLTDPTGTRLFPGIATLEESLRTLIGQSDYQARLGSSSAAVTKDVTRVETGFQVGVFDWLTIGAMAPWVLTRTAIEVGFLAGDASPDLGVSPTVAERARVDRLLQDLAFASLAARARADGLCAVEGSPDCPAAVSLADRATAFEGNVRAAYGASTFFPLEGSGIAALLDASLAALSTDLTSAGIAPIASAMEYSSEPVDAQRFANIPLDQASGIQGAALGSSRRLWGLGDIELSAALRLLEGEARDSSSVSPRFAYTLSAGVLVRVGTGTMDDPDVFLDLGTGEGQTDIEGRVDGALRLGAHLGIRVGARFGQQSSTTLLRRVAPHELVLAPAYTRRTVRWSPASYSLFEVSPRLQITEELALSLDYRRYSKGEDSYDVLGEGSVGAPPVRGEDLSRETEMRLHEAAVGLRFSTRAAWRQGLLARPIEIGVRIVRAVSGAGGQTPKATRAELSLSLFRRLWGSP
jgi:hypothetical protein